MKFTLQLVDSKTRESFEFSDMTVGVKLYDGLCKQESCVIPIENIVEEIYHELSDFSISLEEARKSGKFEMNGIYRIKMDYQFVPFLYVFVSVKEGENYSVKMKLCINRLLHLWEITEYTDHILFSPQTFSIKHRSNVQRLIYKNKLIDVYEYLEQTFLESSRKGEKRICFIQEN